MTIVIGFACKDALVLASDSQMSSESKFKRYDEKKVFAIKFGESHALIAIAGALDPATRFREILEDKARSATLSNPRSIADVFEEAMKETRSHIVRYINDGITTPDERAQHLEMLHFEVMLAYCHNEKPYIYRSALYQGIAVPCQHTFEVMGCGKDVASFILTGCDLSKHETGDAVGLAVYAVEACKKYDIGCGGPFQHLILRTKTKEPPFAVWPKVMNIYFEAFRNAESIIHGAILEAIFKEARKVSVDDDDEDTSAETIDFKKED